MSSNNCEDYSRISAGETGTQYEAYHYTPPPQPKYSKFERLKHLEAVVLMRRVEIESLKQRRHVLSVDLAKRRSQWLRNKQIKEWGIKPETIESGGGRKYIENVRNESNDQSRLSHDQQYNESRQEQKKRYDISDDPANPLNNPIMRFVESTFKPGGCDLSKDIPPGDVGNICTEFEVAADQFDQHSKILKKTILEIELQIKQSEKNQNKIEKRIDNMASITGLPVKGPHEKEDKELPGAAAREAALRAEPDVHPTVRFKKMIRKLEMEVIAANKELHSANLAIGKKRKTTIALEKTLQKKQETENKLLDILNKTKVKAREVEERKRELRALIEEHVRVDSQIEHASKIPLITLAPLQNNLKQINSKLKHCIQEEEKAQERVVKLQDYRIKTLKKRLHAVEQSVSLHCLTKGVDAMLADSCQYEEDLRVNREGSMMSMGTNNTTATAAPSASYTPASPARKVVQRRMEVLSNACTSRLPSCTPDGSIADINGSLLAGTGDITASDALAIEVATMSRNDLYNADIITPPDEKVHPAIYGLLHSENEKLRSLTFSKRLIMEEKEAVYRVLSEDVINNSDDHWEVTEDLIYYSNKAHFMEEQKKERAVKQISDERQYLRDLIKRKEKLIREVTRLKAEAAAPVQLSGTNASLGNTSSSRH
eukprot:Tbor_TRINITY_DN5499_c2_g3::TRINITY_DN5499_c2_g3_i1::g.25422::m.25422